MTVKLKPEDFRRIVEILQSHPDFKNPRDRRRLVEGALEGSPRAETILASLDVESGGPRVAAVEVVKVLADFGQVAYGKEALGVFLNYFQEIVGDEPAEFIAGLFFSYPLNDVAAIRNRPLGRWRGAESPEDVREKIIGENTLRDISMLELALDAAQAVVRIGLPSGAGSGFMIAADLVMTNNFVAYADRQVLQYTTTTLPGSSGAPVFDDAFHVVAIHREGGVLQEPGSGQHYLRNGGTSMIAVLADLKENAPALHARVMT
jgi:hypothetical protein